MEIYDKHKQLYHYTDYDGLEGIYKNNSLWATHFSDLNDSSECLLMKDVLVEHLKPVHLAALKDRRQPLGFTNKKKIKKIGVTKIAKTLTQKLVDTLYHTAIPSKETDQHYCEPFIMSFCSHFKDSSYVQQNGLLSQWRGYAASGGYAIIFDKENLFKQLEKEQKSHPYFLLDIKNVVYQEENEIFKKEFGHFLDDLSKVIQEKIKLEEKDLDLFFNDMISAIIRYKHQSFSEEREVRLFALPHTENTCSYDAKSGIKPHPLPLKPILTRENGKRYISLLGENYKLPIKQVIVGPSADQQKNYEKARAFLDKSIKVTCSETPYIP